MRNYLRRCVSSLTELPKNGVFTKFDAPNLLPGELAQNPTFQACGFGLLEALASDAASSLVSFRFVRTG